MKINSAMRQAGNATFERRQNLEFAHKMRAFRPGPIASLSEDQLAEAIAQARTSADAFGIRAPDLRRLWVMVDLLLLPDFYRNEDVHKHFANASGTGDAKAEDVLQLTKITFRENGRGREIWW